MKTTLKVRSVRQEPVSSELFCYLHITLLRCFNAFRRLSFTPVLAIYIICIAIFHQFSSRRMMKMMMTMMTIIIIIIIIIVVVAVVIVIII